MRKEIDQLLRMSGNDGGSVAVGVHTTPDPNEIDHLLEAWSQERGRSIECLLVLGRVRRQLSRIMASERLTARSVRDIKRLLRAIDLVSKSDPVTEI